MTPDKLDALLRRARWPGDDDASVSQAVERILAGRSTKSPKGVGADRGSWFAAVLSAAAVAIVVAFLAFQTGPAPKCSPTAEPVTAHRHTAPIEAPTRVAESPTASVQQPVDDASEQGELVAMILWHAANRRRQAQTPQPSSVQTAGDSIRRGFAELHRRLEAARRTNRPMLATLTPEWCAEAENRLWRLSRSSDPDRRRMAAWGLGVVGTRRSLSLLHVMLDEPDTMAAASWSLCRLANAHELRSLIQQERRPEVRQRLLAVLTTSGDEQTDLFLDFVFQRATRREALSALRLNRNLKTSQLIARLKADNWQRSRAAALALAVAPSKEASTELLRALASDQTNVHLWMALIARPEPDVRQAVATSSVDAQIAQRIRQAGAQLQRDLSF